MMHGTINSISKSYNKTVSIVYNIALTIVSTSFNNRFPPITLSGEGHLTRGHRGFVKPAGHNMGRDDQPITVDEGRGTSTQHVIVIEVCVTV